jgi:hypothetical protein
MGSEGTPEIVLKDEFGYYFVTFHGFVHTPLFCMIQAQAVVSRSRFTAGMVKCQREELQNPWTL